MNSSHNISNFKQNMLHHLSTWCDMAMMDSAWYTGEWYLDYHNGWKWCWLLLLNYLWLCNYMLSWVLGVSRQWFLVWILLVLFMLSLWLMPCPIHFGSILWAMLLHSSLILEMFLSIGFSLGLCYVDCREIFSCRHRACGHPRLSQWEP